MTTIKKEIIYRIKNKLNYENIVSLNFVGSFVKKINFNDVDIVVIVKKLNKEVFNKYVNQIYKIKFNNLIMKEKKIFVNTTFGPLKFNNENLIVFHLMIYDIDGHRKHVLLSPFTCYDWERSSISLKQPLNKIFPVINLTIKDFDNSRRGIKNYINDLKNNRLSYSQYHFTKNSFKLKKKFIDLDKSESRLYLEHILYFTIVNLYKYSTRKNSLPNNKDYQKTLEDFSKGINTTKLKKNNLLSKNYILKILDNIFLNISRIIINSKKIHVYRHFKTKYSSKIFIGQKIDVSINYVPKRINKISFRGYVKYVSNSRRTLDTLKILIPNLNIKKVIFDNRINEIDYGLAEGLNLIQFLKIYPEYKRMWIKNKIVKFPQGESYYDLSRRVNSFLNSLIAHKENKFLILTHNNVLRYFIAKSLNLKLSEIYKLNISYGKNILFFINENNKIEILSNRLVWQSQLQKK